MALFEHSIRERAALDAALLRLGLDLDEAQRAALLDHLKLVLEKNQVLNLTRITSFEEAVVLHVEDSLSCVEVFSQLEGPVVDIGTGAGFPGVPLAIATGAFGCLMDSVKKKAAAVSEFVDALGLGEQLVVSGERSEEHALRNPEAYGVVVARAVTALPSLLELASPLLCCGGHLLAMKGAESFEDEAVFVPVAQKLGFTFCEMQNVSVGTEGIQRNLYLFEKTHSPEVKLPRRPGMAQKKPYSA